MEMNENITTQCIAFGKNMGEARKAIGLSSTELGAFLVLFTFVFVTCSSQVKQHTKQS